MNTKYPINGRVATLNDIVHEYGASSSWPKDNKKYDLIDNHESIVSQPFQNLVFKDTLDANNKFIGERPYEIVYFDNVYSNTEKDSTGKHMKIIQKSDSSVFTDNYPGGISGHEYIKAGDVVNPVKIISGKYGFKFIVASQNDKKQYYYNYRTSTGEATVMYALRNIIRILKEYISNNNTSGNIDNILKTKLQQLFIYDSANEHQPFEYIIENNELKSDAYKYLGDFIWTYKNISIKNYTRTEQSILNIAERKGYLTLNNNVSFSNINDLLTDWVGNNIDNNYSYNQKSYYNQLKYYLNIFANSQRFFVSYVTGFRFGKISNKSYLQAEPVLRCDLGVFMLYKDVDILESIHDWRTALPQGAISPSKQFDIILKYQVTYENISKKSTPITTTISFTWNDIITNSKNNSGKKWFTLRNAVCEDKDTDEDKGGYKNYIDDTKKFGKYTYEDGKGYFLNINDMSLKKLTWPYNEPLQLTDETEFKNIINNPLYNKNHITNYANTANKDTFGKTDNDIKKIIYGYSAPFGTLRIHNFLDNNNEKSGYYCDVDILRCKNFYMIQQNLKVSNIGINIYYSIPYDTIIPNTYVRLISKSFEEVEASDDNTAVKDRPNDIIAYQKEDLKKDIVYSIPNNSDNEVFITISSTTSKVRLYASGETEPLNSTSKDSYINNLNLELYYLDSTTWQLAEKGVDYVINAYTRPNTLPYYSFKFIKSYNKTYVFWKFKFNDIKQFLYFRSNDIQQNDKQQLSIWTLHVYDENSATIEKKVKGQNNIDISLQYLIYHADDNTDYTKDTTCLNCFTHAFSATLHTIQNTNVYVNKNQSFYIEPISFKTSDSYQYQEFNITKHNPFNVAYETQTTVNNKKIYKFVQCSTLFGKDIENRRAFIEQIHSDTQSEIYLALEPIYIIEFGKIQFSTAEEGGKPLVDNECKTRYADKRISLNKFKFKINSAANISSIDLQNNHIISLYTSDIFIDCDFLSLIDKSIDEDLQDITSSYLISYDIVISKYDFSASNYVEMKNGKIPISNGLTKTQINEKFYKIKFEPNKQYLADIIFTKYRKRTGEIACTFFCTDSRFDGFITLLIIDLPDGYNGELSNIKNPPYYSTSGSTRPISLPIGCTVKLKHNFDVLLKTNGDKIKWNGWIYPGVTKADINNEITFKIGDTLNISITANLYADPSITVNSSSTPSTPSTPDTSNNKP